MSKNLLLLFQKCIRTRKTQIPRGGVCYRIVFRSLKTCLCMVSNIRTRHITGGKDGEATCRKGTEKEIRRYQNNNYYA